MTEEKHSASSALRKRSVRLRLPDGLRDAVVSGIVTTAAALVTSFFSFFISKSKSPAPDVISILQSLSYLVGGIALLAVIIVSLTTFIRRKNRDVILLRQRLARIYLSALRKSAFNPQLKSSDEWPSSLH
jgi:hypothetical protein